MINSYIKENMKQIATICERKGVEMVDGKYFQSYPDEEGMVGHFSAIVKQKPRNKKEF